jgi:hypothetical protein
VNNPSFSHQDKARMREAYREFKAAHPGTVDGMATVKSFKNSTYCQWSGTVEEIYHVVIGRQGD